MPKLDWLTRPEDEKTAASVPYRLLEAVPELSHGDEQTENMLIQGDNLDALKALLPFYAGRVKCIYIDPPYNTGKALENYDDNLEHSIWLQLMYPRLMLLKELLSQDGFICCHIDDSEGPYLKVLMDEVFGRKNYLVTLFVLVRYADKTLTQDMDFHKQVEQIHVYARSSASKPNRIQEEIVHDKFCFQIETAETPTKVIELGGKRTEVFAKTHWSVRKVAPSVQGLKEIWATGSILDGNSSGRFFRDYLAGRVAEDGLGALYKIENIGDDGLGYRFFTGPQKATATKGKYYQGVPTGKQKGGVDESPIENYLDMAGAFGNCRLEGGVGFRAGKKPEALLQAILTMFSNVGDLVADSFLGSGSTAATATKMGRRFIGIEMGEQAITHCVPRLKAVIDGEQSGISKVTGWQGGGGFRFYKLGSSVFDEHGQINQAIRFDHLAAHVWFSETRTPIPFKRRRSPLLGIYEGTAYYLLYNGILGDKRPDGGNVLTRKVLADLPEHDGPRVIYGESSRLSPSSLEQLGIVFKQTPYDLKAR